MKKDYYDVLGIAKTASASEIKKAYRKLAMKYHPDVNSEADSEERFKEINEAYEILSDEEKRAIYDRYGHDGLKSQGAGPSGFGGFNFEDLTNFNFGGIFEDLFSGGGFNPFGGGRNSNHPQRGKDIHQEVKITFEQALKGLEVNKDIMVNRPCSQCNGKGYEKERDVETCSDCKGTGKVVAIQDTMFGRMQVQKACPKCKGKGKIVKKACPKCKGKKLEMVKQTINVKIPAGISDQSEIRFRGKGHDGLNNGPPGDFLLRVIVKKHKYFKRVDNDIHLNFKIPMIKMMLGSKYELPFFGEEISFEVPPLTEPNTVIRIKDKGFNSLSRKIRGNLYIELKGTLPNKINKQTKVALEKLEEELNDYSDEDLLKKIKKD